MGPCVMTFTPKGKRHWTYESFYERVDKQEIGQRLDDARSEGNGNGKVEALERLFAEAGDDGAQALVFAVGGPFGHGPAMRARADHVVRLSSCCLNHEVARVVLLEQVYRAWTILRGEPYHH